MTEAQATSTREVVKKHAGAVHIKNDLSCLQRKVWDVLLHNAYDQLPDSMVIAHQIRVRDLMELAGFDSKNVAYLKEALEDMVTTKLTWNIIDGKGKKEWGVSAALASAVIVDGMCSYAYSPHLRQKLYNPEYYAGIDILINRKFDSNHALALYQNCVRYRNIHQTPYFSLELFRDLIGVGENSSYDDFKVLNRAVIKPAMKEINTVSDISVDVEMRREKRKVVGLKFIIQENVQGSLPIEATVTFNVEILARLQEYFCLTEKQAKEALVTHSEDRITAAMQYVEERYLAGKIKKGQKGIAPYFLKILKDGDIQVGESAFDRAKREVSDKRKAAQAGEAEIEQLIASFKAERQNEVRNYIEGLVGQALDAVHAEFDQYLAGRNMLAYPRWKKSGLTTKMVQTEFNMFIEQKILPPYDLALESFLKAQQAA
ncbi:replication initiation protein [Chromobacterium haemolyticum]|uniref:replication initiation protein n=1 Tax=Chromobacterium haemolyticum TaxID=394935 RepID=UPI00244A65C3|nr:replication initiation protein [Chromobacterium haemolyticum]MDH0341994.1 replication initiation protein [Chromobacterium haemolyticum]